MSSGAARESTRRSLLERVRDLGDEGAWREFDERYRELILRFCRRRGLQPADAEDVRQEVLLSLTRALPDFVYRPEVGRFRDYLGTLVRHTIWRRLSGQVRAPAPLSPADLARASQRADDGTSEWNEEWMLHHYRAAMGRVRSEFRPQDLAIFDRLLAGERGIDVAAGCGLSPEAVYKVKQRVRDALRVHVERQLREEAFEREPPLS